VLNKPQNAKELWELEAVDVKKVKQLVSCMEIVD